MPKSFYNLDYIIEINEKRLEQYTAAYQLIMSKFTNIFIIYSSIAIFLSPCIQTLFFTTVQSITIYACFAIFLVFFITSIAYTIRLLIQEKVAYLIEPKIYYTDLLQQYQNRGDTQDQIEIYLKGSYINELELALDANDKLFKKKGKYYHLALVFVLISILPYLVCLGYHFSKGNKIQKIEITNLPKNYSNFTENTDTMASKKSNAPILTTTTKLPNVDSSKIIPSRPQLVREGSDIDSNHPAKKNSR